MTQNYYQTHSQAFFDGTVAVDMSSLYAAFTPHLPAGARVLDAGCGSGRDALAFHRMGYDVDAFDASRELVALARAHSGLPVKEMTFNDVDAVERYDGIWCCASLLHLSHDELPGAMQKLSDALRPGGVWYLSFKYGEGEREQQGRRFTDMNEARLTALLAAFPALSPLALWITQDKRPARREQWLNGLLVKR
ncbi:class I SAM-dependent methyltransferase [Cronobacter dublinensis]|uniref:class I SAM-dependent methyltransferase n=1 Tax=Cronobacter dublinensis TaxID=413497 RepID=UPI000CFE516F|nr:class I SAM-dependent methyltransferase [Cronobacter dublinensis]